MGRVMIAQWENECISLFVLPVAWAMIAQWENECISLSVHSHSAHLLRDHNISRNCLAVFTWTYLQANVVDYDGPDTPLVLCPVANCAANEYCVPHPPTTTTTTTTTTPTTTTIATILASTTLVEVPSTATTGITTATTTAEITTLSDTTDSTDSVEPPSVEQGNKAESSESSTESSLGKCHMTWQVRIKYRKLIGWVSHGLTGQNQKQTAHWLSVTWPDRSESNTESSLGECHMTWQVRTKYRQLTGWVSHNLTGQNQIQTAHWVSVTWPARSEPNTDSSLGECHMTWQIRTKYRQLIG